jgi:hypothetical protein
MAGSDSDTTRRTLHVLPYQQKFSLIIECLVWLLGRSDDQRWDQICAKSDRLWNDRDVGVFSLEIPMRTHHGVPV